MLMRVYFILGTYIGQLPLAHGLRVNEIVRFGPSNGQELFLYGEGKWNEQSFSGAPIAPMTGQCGIVVEYYKHPNSIVQKCPETN